MTFEKVVELDRKIREYWIKKNAKKILGSRTHKEYLGMLYDALLEVPQFLPEDDLRNIITKIGNLHLSFKFPKLLDSMHVEDSRGLYSRLLRDKNHDVRENCAKYLGLIPRYFSFNKNDAYIINLLNQFLEDTNPVVRSNAVSNLAMIYPYIGMENYIQFCKKAMEDSSIEVHISAIKQFGEKFSNTLIKQEKEIFDSFVSPYISDKNPFYKLFIVNEFKHNPYIAEYLFENYDIVFKNIPDILKKSLEMSNLEQKIVLASNIMSFWSAHDSFDVLKIWNQLEIESTECASCLASNLDSLIEKISKKEFIQFIENKGQNKIPENIFLVYQNLLEIIKDPNNIPDNLSRETDVITYIENIKKVSKFLSNDDINLIYIQLKDKYEEVNDYYFWWVWASWGELNQIKNFMSRSDKNEWRELCDQRLHKIKTVTGNIWGRIVKLLPLDAILKMYEFQVDNTDNPPDIARGFSCVSNELLTRTGELLDNPQFNFLRKYIKNVSPEKQKEIFTNLEKWLENSGLNYNKMSDIFDLNPNAKLEELIEYTSIECPGLIIDTLGEGVFGKTYRLNLGGGRVAALKIIYSDIMDKISQDEFEVLSSLNHPNIVKVRERYNKNDNYAKIKGEPVNCIIMDEVEGKTLEKILKKYPKGFDENLALSYSYVLLDVVMYMIERGYEHRDIYPSNLMIDKNGNLVLIDFSFAMGKSSKNKGNFYRDTVRNRTFGGVNDIVSWAFITYLMYQGKHLFGSQKENQTDEDYKTQIYNQIKTMKKQGKLKKEYVNKIYKNIPHDYMAKAMVYGLENTGVDEKDSGLIREIKDIINLNVGSGLRDIYNAFLMNNVEIDRNGNPRFKEIDDKTFLSMLYATEEFGINKIELMRSKNPFTDN